ncbi:MAG: hypothetical protein Q9205_001837 [Flavoplaca limonia]
MAAHASKPFRFIYTSGVTVERDQEKTLPFLSEYRLMRGRVENAVLDFAKQHEDQGVEVTVAKPGGIESRAATQLVPHSLQCWRHSATLLR